MIEPREKRVPLDNSAANANECVFPLLAPKSIRLIEN